MLDLKGLQDPEALASQVRADVLPPPPSLTVSEWADAERILGSEESSEPGRWKTARIPYLKAIMDAFSDAEVRTVVVKGSARIGKTEFFNNVIGYVIDQDPCPMLLVYPSEGKAKDYSKEKLDPMLRNTPALRGKVAEAKSRDSGNTMLHKVFQGGYLALTGSNTPNGLDSRTCRVVAFDELDKCAKAAKHLGDPRALAKNRTLTYPGRFKHLFVSTPSEEGDSPITDEYEKTNQQQLYLPCPHCQTYDILRFEQVRWPDGQPDQAVYACRECGAIITDSDKPGMLARHEWRAERPGPHNGSVGFWLNALYSPWTTWAQIATVFVERRADGPESLKVFINEWLGECWKPNQGQETRVEGLLLRARDSRYLSGTVPNECGILMGGADVQDDRLEFLVHGVGVGRREWMIKHVVIDGNLATLTPWDRLEEIILTPWIREDGQEMQVSKVCIDHGGHFPNQVMAFCRRPRLRGIVVPIKGASAPQLRPAIRSKKKSRLWLLDVAAIKDTVAASLRIDNPTFPGYRFFPTDTETNFFQQLTCEKKIKGKWTPVPIDARNEAWDMSVYIEGALHIYGLRNGEMEALVNFYAEGKGRKARPKAPRKEVQAAGEPEANEEPGPLGETPEDVPLEEPKAPETPSRALPSGRPIVARPPGVRPSTRRP